MSDRSRSGTLYVVATPIGNLSDASPRSVEVLKAAALVACEDTRTSATLLGRFHIEARTVALHEHNERAAAGALIEVLQQGNDVALVTDAGTPGLSDPGAHLVARAHQAGIRVSPIPGPSAAAAAYSAAGFPSAQFFFAGFLPASGAPRRRALEALDMACPVILFEAPHRVARTLQELAAHLGPEREVVVGRELSKKFEEVARMTLGEASGWLDGHAHRSQGEFVLVLGPGEVKPPASVDTDRVLDALLAVLPPSEAAKTAARITGSPKAALYRRALERAK